MNSKIYSATTVGVNAKLVTVEVDLSFGLINFFIVGLPDTAIKESRQRIQTALKNAGIKIPDRKITVNLAPANLKKEGTLFDLPIAVGIMHAANLFEIEPEFLNETLFVGELSLDGSITGINGALPIAYDAKNCNKKRLILPKENELEAAVVSNIEIISVSNLQELLYYLRKEKNITPSKANFNNSKSNKIKNLNFSDVKGQEYAKRALQISAAGRHNLLFYGPPGAGKTMLAQRICSIMPELSFEESLETSKIYSICGKLENNNLILNRPFRAPHHSISQAGLIGGGSYPKPGEVSLAHNGILFLDELTEFKKDALESLRQPLESLVVNISRINQSINYPSNFLLIGACNPCPCGFKGDLNKICVCSEKHIKNYSDKLSGPLLDRIDIKISVNSVSYSDAIKNTIPLSSENLKIGVEAALKMQENRFKTKFKFNSQITSNEIEQYCILSEAAKSILEKAFLKLKLSMRAYHKTLKLARTIADIESSETITEQHIKTAILYKS